MKIHKYWKTIVAIVVIISSLSTYYVSGYMEDQAYPDFQFQTIEGDETLLEPLVLSGAYYTDDEEHGQYFQLAHEDFIYRHQQGFIDDLKGVPFSYERELKENYSSLLRSSRYTGYLTVENETHIGLAQIQTEHEWSGNGGWSWDSTLHVKVADKQTGDITKMSHDLGEGSNDGWSQPPHLEGIQFNDSEVVVFLLTRQYESGTERQNAEAFVFDIDTEAFKQKNTILSVTDDEALLNRLYETPQWAADKYVVYRVMSEKPSHVEQPDDDLIDVGDVGDFEHVESVERAVAVAEEELTAPARSSKLYAYDVSTHERVELHLPEAYRDQEVRLFDGENLYFVESGQTAERIKVYNIASGEITSDFEIEASINTFFSTYEGMLYVIEMQMDENRNSTPRVYVYDAGTGERLYLGEVVPVNASEAAETFSVDIYQINFRY